ncbi:MAG: hypothetical protein A2W23_01925 [Planctomycetes bacterium RBG_16_43_13]|nr:MAG: hypothetical protein A2W23_01925 [Planctomycetes bacterium RBG_16_43_13]
MSGKLLTRFFLLALFAVGLTAESQTVHLKPGVNEIVVKINNKSALSFSSAYLDTRHASLPEEITISANSQRLDVAANTLSNNGLILQVNVDDGLEPGIYEIPLVLRDEANHSWSFTLTAELASQKPASYELGQNYPNPFNATTQIKYALAARDKQNTRLIIYDLLGRHIRTLVDKEQAGGAYQVSWDGKDDYGQDVASGVYFYQLRFKDQILHKKMLLLR